MARIKLRHPAPPWQPALSEFVVVFHGCIDTHRVSIEKNGIDFAKGNSRADFGLGFYLTTSLRQAEHWAWLKSQTGKLKSKQRAVVLQFVLPRESLAGLAGLHFVRGDHGFDDYWSFVQHCRLRGTGFPHDHGRSSGKWYDMVSGPVSAFWRQRTIMPDSDQFSLHTTIGATMIEDAISDRQKTRYRWIAVS